MADAAASLISWLFEDKIKETVILKMIEMITGELKPEQSEFIKMLLQMYANRPKPTGNEEADSAAWRQFIDTAINKFERASGMHIEDFFNEDFKINFKNFTGRDSAWLSDREAIINLLHGAVQFKGLAEGFLKHPLKNLKGRSIMAVDRFNMYLPQWIMDLDISPGIAYIGDTKSQKIINMPSVGVLGFVTYEEGTFGGLDYKQPMNPFEMFNARPKGKDKYNNVYEYRYFGPNNEIPSPLGDGKPINLLDEIAYQHDLSYQKYGYNTPGAREADRVMVNAIDEAIRDGRINENSPYDELSLAKSARLYFSTVQIK